MQLESLVCNSCGAPLKVPASANFVTCGHCSSQLQIRRTESTTYTELLTDLVEKTEELSEQVQDLAANSELNAIDNAWRMERESLLVRDKHGKSHVPTKSSSTAAGIMITMFGGLWTAIAISITSTAPPDSSFAIAKVLFPAFGVIFIAIGIYNSTSRIKKAKKYEQAERRYRKRRSDTDRC